MPRSWGHGRECCLRAIQQRRTVLIDRYDTQYAARNRQGHLNMVVKEFLLPVVVTMRHVNGEWRVYATPYNEVSESAAKEPAESATRGRGR